MIVGATAATTALRFDLAHAVVAVRARAVAAADEASCRPLAESQPAAPPP